MSSSDRHNRPGARGEPAADGTRGHVEKYEAAIAALTDVVVHWQGATPENADGPSLKLLLTTEEAAERIGVGRTTVYALIRAGKLRTVKIGRRRLVPLAAITELIRNLMEEMED